MATWGEFQSLFQLSVALNAAFAVLHDIVGTAPQTGVATAHDLGERANIIGAHDLASELFQLESKLAETSANFQSRIFHGLGPWCLGIAVFALVFLAISSIYYINNIHCLFQAYALVQFIPFLAGACLALRAAVFDNIKMTRELQSLETQLKLAERAHKRNPQEGEAR
ncbi:hypothetical protein ACX4MT_00030 [Roseomonas mucosa]